MRSRGGTAFSLGCEFIGLWVIVAVLYLTRVPFARAAQAFLLPATPFLYLQHLRTLAPMARFIDIAALVMPIIFIPWALTLYRAKAIVLLSLASRALCQ